MVRSSGRAGLALLALLAALAAAAVLGPHAASAIPSCAAAKTAVFQKGTVVGGDFPTTTYTLQNDFSTSRAPGNPDASRNASNDIYVDYCASTTSCADGALTQGFILFPGLEQFLPADAVVNTATLSVYFADGSGAGANHLFVGRLLVPVSPATSTWNSLGDGISAAAGEVVMGNAFPSTAAGSTVSVDVKTIVSNWITNPASNYGFLVTIDDTDGVLLGGARYPTVSLRPKLTVSYTLGVTQTVFQFREGLNGYAGTVDTWIRGDLPTVSQNADAFLWIDWGTTSAEKRQTLVNFVGAFGGSGVPVGNPLGYINSATLRMFTTDITNADGAAATVAAMLASWDSTVTWDTNLGSGGNGVIANNVEAAATNMATLAVGGLNTAQTADISAMAEMWRAGTWPWNGFLLYFNDSTDGHAYSSSRQTAARQTERPTLTIDYRQCVSADSTAPFFDSGPLLAASGTSATVTWSVSEGGTVYCYTDLVEETAADIRSVPGAVAVAAAGATFSGSHTLSSLAEGPGRYVHCQAADLRTPSALLSAVWTSNPFTVAIPPVWTSGYPQLAVLAGGGLRATVSLDDYQSVWCVAAAQPSSQPAAAAIKLGAAGGFASGASSSAGTSPADLLLSAGLAEKTAYDVYCVAEDSFGNQALSTKRSATTADLTPPAFDSVPALSLALSGGGASVTVSFSVTEAADVYCVASASADAGGAADLSLVAGQVSFAATTGPAFSGSVTITPGTGASLYYVCQARDYGSPARRLGAAASAGPLSVDSTPPSAVSIELRSTRSGEPLLARSGDSVQLLFTLSEPATVTSVTIGGVAASVTGTSPSFVATVSAAALGNGPASTFAISCRDAAGNAGVITESASAFSGAPAVTVDLLPPQVTSSLRVTDVRASGGDLSVTYGESCGVSCVAVLADALTAPPAATVISLAAAAAQTGGITASSTVRAVFRGSASASTALPFALSGLRPATLYDVYCAADDEGLASKRGAARPQNVGGLQQTQLFTGGCLAGNATVALPTLRASGSGVSGSTASLRFSSSRHIFATSFTFLGGSACSMAQTATGSAAAAPSDPRFSWSYQPSSSSCDDDWIFTGGLAAALSTCGFAESGSTAEYAEYRATVVALTVENGTTSGQVFGSGANLTRQNVVTVGVRFPLVADVMSAAADVFPSGLAFSAETSQVFDSVGRNFSFVLATSVQYPYELVVDTAAVGGVTVSSDTTSGHTLYPASSSDSAACPATGPCTQHFQIGLKPADQLCTVDTVLTTRLKYRCRSGFTGSCDLPAPNSPSASFAVQVSNFCPALVEVADVTSTLETYASSSLRAARTPGTQVTDSVTSSVLYLRVDSVPEAGLVITSTELQEVTIRSYCTGAGCRPTVQAVSSGTPAANAASGYSFATTSTSGSTCLFEFRLNENSISFDNGEASGSVNVQVTVIAKLTFATPSGQSVVKRVRLQSSGPSTGSTAASSQIIGAFSEAGTGGSGGAGAGAGTSSGSSTVLGSSQATAMVVGAGVVAAVVAAVASVVAVRRRRRLQLQQQQKQQKQPSPLATSGLGAADVSLAVLGTSSSGTDLLGGGVSAEGELDPSLVADLHTVQSAYGEGSA